MRSALVALLLAGCATGAADHQPVNTVTMTIEQADELEATLRALAAEIIRLRMSQNPMGKCLEARDRIS